ncbi:putative Zn-dependent peptidase [Lysinibacillus parviboronicapiens]|uniref:Zn-dependent peptidase n=1 Tax=Lysinibacillus parviboronicapiens TaxID=436516 RepID=A0ABV2PPT8_9BACI
MEIKSGIENLKTMSKKSNSLLSETAKQEKDMYDIGEEIRELKELLEDDLITEEEFNAKKKQLLGI